MVQYEKEAEVDKAALLVEKARVFKALIDAEIQKDPRFQWALDKLGPYFDAIEAGRLKPPYPKGELRTTFHMDDPLFGLGSAMHDAEGEFLSALEDWPSKAWFQRLQKEP